MDRLFQPPKRSNRGQLERLDQLLTLKYRDYHSALDFALHSSPPVTHEPQVLFDPPDPLVPPPQVECLF